MVLFFTFIFAVSNANAMDVQADSKNSDSRVIQDLMNQLHSSIRNYKYEETETIVKQNPLLIDVFGLHEVRGVLTPMTPVHVASLEGNGVALRCMLSISKKSVNAITKTLFAPLHMAMNKKVASLLLKNGAEVNVQDAYGATPLWNALWHTQGSRFKLAECLIKYGAYVNYHLPREPFNNTLLHHAANFRGATKIVEFLLQHGADPYIKNSLGDTSLDIAIRAGCSLKPFEKVGVYEFVVSKQAEDTYALLNNNAHYFRKIMLGDKAEKKVMALTALARLFFMCDKSLRSHHAIVYPNSCHKEKKSIFLRDGVESQLFDNINYDFVEDHFGKENADYVRERLGAIYQCVLCQLDDQWDTKSIVKRYPFVFYCNDIVSYRILKHMIMHGKSLMDVPHEADISVSPDGQSLLHIAVSKRNAEAIKWLIEHDIDCSIKDKQQGKTAIDYLKELGDTDVEKECKNSFFYCFHRNFLKNKLDKANEKLVITKFFNNDLYLYRGNTLFFESLLKRPDKCSFFLKQGTLLNYKTKRGVSPLAALLNECIKKEWHEISNNNKYLIRLLLEHNAIVEERFMKAVKDSYLRSLLQNAYEKQNCCICWEHPEELSNIPCDNRHTDFICRDCYDQNIKRGCPLCQSKMYPFYW